MLKKLHGLLLSLFLCGVLAYAQATGRMTGTVTDPAGASVPGAIVSLYLPGGTKPAFTTTTSSDGLFTFSNIRPDTYTLTIESPGFGKFSERNVKVDPSAETPIRASLSVQSTNQTVEVTASNTNVETTNSQISTTITQSQVQNLPVLDRQVSNLFLTQPGVSEGNGNAATINGLRTSAANVTLDGVNIQDNYIRTNSLDYIPSKLTIEQVAEFTVATANATSALGGGAAQIALITPSGTNQFHGSLYEYNRNSFFGANDWFNNQSGVKRPFLNQNQLGGSLGGRIIKDKLFFYGNYEAYRRRQQSPITAIILTPSARNGIFTYRDTSGTLRSVNLLNLRGITPDPTVAALLAQIPATGNISTVGDGLNTTGYQFNARDNENRDAYTSKIDYILSPRHSFSASYIYNTDVLDRPDIESSYGGYTAVPAVSNNNYSKIFATSWRYTITPTLTNEVRGGFDLAPGTFNSSSTNPAYFLGSNGYLGAPSTSSYGFITDPTNQLLSQGRNTQTYTWQDNANWVKGKHTVAFGMQTQYIRTTPYNYGGTVPTVALGISTANTTGLTAADLPGVSSTLLNTANALYTLLGGIYSSVSQTDFITSTNSGYVAGAPQKLHLRYNNYAPYVQDQWRIKPRVTLTLGLRWDYFSPVSEDNGLYFLPNIASGTSYIADLLNPNQTFSLVKPGQPLYKRDLNNFAPNIGLAWDLFGDGKTAFRAGYSISYINDDTISTINNNAGTNVGTSVSLSRTNLVGNLAGGAPTLAIPQFNSTTVTSGNYALSSSNALAGPDPNLVTPYVQQYSASVEHRIWDGVFAVRYVGNHATKLLRGIDYNQVQFPAGYLQDFINAQNNGFAAIAAGRPFSPVYNAAIPGSVPTPFFNSLPSGGLLTNATVQNYIRQGQVGTLAQTYQTNGLNGNYSFFPNPDALGVNVITNYSNSTYNSLQLDYRRNFRNGLQFQANYVFSKVLSDAAGTASTNFEPFLDINNAKLARARAPYDINQVFKLNGYYLLPIGKGKLVDFGRVGNAILAGWAVSSNLTYQTGAPFSILSGRGTLNRGSRSTTLETANTTLTGSQLNSVVGYQMTGNGPVIINPANIGPGGLGTATDGSAPFTGQAFSNPGPGQVGNLQLRYFTGQNFFNIDSALQKNFYIREKQYIQIRAEAFDTTNHPVFYIPDQNINSATFGKLTSLTSTPRVFQFGAYYRF